MLCRENFLFIYGFIYGSSLLHKLFSSCSAQGATLVEVLGLLIAEHGLQGKQASVAEASGL